MQKRIIIFLILTILGLNTNAQVNEKFERLSRTDGLSHNNVYSILQDRYGFMWFGTQDGLNKYDGYSFQKIYHEASNNNSLISSNFGKIYEDSKGFLWFGSYINGLDQYDPIKKVFKHFFHDENDSTSISSNRIRCFKESKDGYIWIATSGGGLNKLDPLTGESIHFKNNEDDWNSISDNNVNSLVFDDLGRLWIGTDVGLDLFNIEANLFSHYELGRESFDDNKKLPVRNMMIDKYGIIWIGTTDGLFVLDPMTNEIREYNHHLTDPTSISSGSINEILEDSEGTIWIGTEDGGLNKYIREKDNFRSYTHDVSDPSSISSNRVWSLYEDKSKNLWIGTKGGGINKLNLKRKRFHNMTYIAGSESSIPSPSVYAITGDTTGNIWIGTDGGGLCSFLPEKNTFNYFRTKPFEKNTLSDDEIWSICTDKRNRILIGTHSGGLNIIEQINGEQLIKTLSHKPNDSLSISNNQINNIFEDKKGNIWIGTRNGLNKLVTKNDETFAFVKYFSNYSDNNSLSDNYITSVYQDHHGFIWAGTYSEGLNQLDEINNKITHFKNNPANVKSISSNSINVIFEDHLGTLWIGTKDGLNKFNSSDLSFKRYYRNNGLPSNEIMGILEDNSGNLWISTSNGLSKFDYINENFINFDITDGLVSDGFNLATYKDMEGKLYFGTNLGMVSFFPDEIILSTYEPLIVITSVKILKNQKWVEKANFVSVLQEIREPVELDYNNNIITIEFAAFDYTKPTENSFEYKIEGLDDNWVSYGSKRSITITNLEPGDYIFKVRGTNSDNLLNERGVSVKIKVSPPFWRTNGFLFILIVLAILGITSIYSFLVKLKTNKILEEKNQELEDANQRLRKSQEDLRVLNKTKDKFFSIIAHDLRNPFNPLLALTELLHDDYDTFEEKERREFIKDIRDGAKRLYDLLENLLQWSLSQTQHKEFSKSKLEMRDLIKRNIDLLKINSNKKKIKIINEVKNDIYILAEKNMVNSIVRNLINNALKFSPEMSKITISCKDLGSKYQFAIKDEGIGVKAEYIETIFDFGFSKTKINRSKEKGSGLGLILCKEFVEKNDGEIWLESEIEKGSTFYFTIPKA